MKVDILDANQITSGPYHHAFTDIQYWKGKWYLVYRKAQTHGIIPPGTIEIHTSENSKDWHHAATISHGVGNVLTGDCRDPKLIESDDALFLLCGAYLPKSQSSMLAEYSTQNLLQSYVSYTEDGDSWSPLQPVGRPGYWIWSAVAPPDAKNWFAAAYHTGSAYETSSIYLLGGDSLLDLKMYALMYDGSSLNRSGNAFDCAHTSPAEPVLFVQDAETLGCCLRTEAGMEIGVARYPFQDWRWHDTKGLIHPSAVLDTPYGRMMVGREKWLSARADVAGGAPTDTYAYSTSLFSLDAQHVSAPLLRLPSAGDTGYAGLCATPAPDRYLVSYYSQHTTGRSFRTRLPGSHVFLAAVTTRRNAIWQS